MDGPGAKRGLSKPLAAGRPTCPSAMWPSSCRVVHSRLGPSFLQLEKIAVFQGHPAAIHSGWKLCFAVDQYPPTPPALHRSHQAVHRECLVRCCCVEQPRYFGGDLSSGCHASPMQTGTPGYLPPGCAHPVPHRARCSGKDAATAPSSDKRRWRCSSGREGASTCDLIRCCSR